MVLLVVSRLLAGQEEFFHHTQKQAKRKTEKIKTRSFGEIFKVSFA